MYLASLDLPGIVQCVFFLQEWREREKNLDTAYV